MANPEISVETRRRESLKGAAPAPMTIEAFLAKLDAVRACGANRWRARCPAHADKSPSLSIRATDDGTILLRCFAACDNASICEALGIGFQDLFADSRRLRNRAVKKSKPVYPADADPAEIARAHFLDGIAGVLAAPYPTHTPDRRDGEREARFLIAAASGHDISTWTEAELDRRLNGLADAYAIVERGEADEQ